MDYIEALRLFGFTSNFTKEELKKRYLELSKKYHPDLNGDEEMMKKVNSAYEVLNSGNSQYKTAKKQNNYDKTLIKYYNILKEKLSVYASKTVYLPNMLEYKYAKAIEETIEKFNFIKPMTVLDYFYNTFLNRIKDLFAKYKREVLKNVPEFWISKFEPINDKCSFDEYAYKVNKIRAKYEKIDKYLDKIILSMFENKKINSKILEEIVDIKEIILKEIVDEKITLEDGIYKLQAEIKTRILRSKTLNNKIWDTYKAIMNNFNKRMMKLKPSDIEDINIAMIVFNRAMAKLKAVQLGTEDEKVLSTLGSLTFTNNDELKESEYELYITANLSDNEETEIVLKKGEVGNFVSFLKKFPSGMAEEVFMTKEGFYKKYNNFKDVLKDLNFLGDKGYIQYLNTKFITTALYYYESTGCYILLTENDKILLVSFNEFHSLNTHATDTASRRYKEKQALYDRFYNSFLKNKKEMKFKNNENNILKREKNKENI